MKIGRLRKRVTIQTPTLTQNDYGEPGATWTDVVTVWGAIEPLRGREFFSAKEVQSDVTTRILIRYRTGLNPKMRIQDANGNTYLIESIINPEMRDKELQLMCREILT